MQTVGIQGGGQHVSQDGRGRAGAGKIGKESGMVPLGHGRHDQAVKILQDGLKGFSLSGSRTRETVHKFPRLCGGHYRVFTGIGKVVSYPLYSFVSGAPKVLNIFIPGVLFVCGCGGAFGTSWFEHKYFR